MPPGSSRRPTRPDRSGERPARPGTRLQGSAKAPGSAAGDPLIGHTIAGHKILQRVSSEAVCVTYKANHSAMARLVSFKALTAEAAADHMILAQFDDTAKSAAKVHHPNIISIYDVGEAQNIHFCTLEHVEGRSVGELLKARQKIASDDAIRVAIDVAEALRFANAKGMPGFVLSADRVVLSNRGEVKILPPTLVHPESPVLNEAYVLYGVGVLLYAMLSGGKMGDVEAALSAARPVAGKLEPMKKVAMGTRKAIADVVDRLVGVPGAAPYRNVEGALTDLRGLLQKQEKAETRSRSATDRAKTRRKHTVAIAASAIGIGAVCLTIIFVLLSGRGRRQRARLRAFADAQAKSKLSVDQAMALMKQFWPEADKAIADKAIASYVAAKAPYAEFMATYRNSPEAQDAQYQIRRLDTAIQTQQVRIADYIQDMKERRAYKALYDSFKADIEQKVNHGGKVDEPTWRKRFAALLVKFPDSPWVHDRVNRFLRTVHAQVQSGEMRIETNQLARDFTDKYRPKHQYGKALAAWERYRAKYDKIDALRMHALTNHDTQTKMIRRDAAEQFRKRMNHANFLAQKKDHARARQIYQEIIDSFGIKRMVDEAKDALAKLPK